MNQIQTVLICGFLGAGKTTLLSHLLNLKKFKDKKCAVLVNDFGAVPVDAEILADNEHFIAKINKGNIFCVCVKADLINAMDQIANEIKPDILFIEATGLAEPSDFSSLLVTDALKQKYLRNSVFCIVDALNFHKLATIMTAPVAQVKLADAVIINKIDLVDEATLNSVKKQISEINSTATIYTSEYGKIELPLINAQNEPNKTNAQLAPGPKEDYERFDLIHNKKINKIKFYKILDEFRHNIFRAKGVVEFEGKKRIFVEVVNGTISSKPASTVKAQLKEYKTAISFIMNSKIYCEFSKKIESELL